MPVLSLSNWPDAKEVVAPTGVATASPTSTSDTIFTENSRQVRVYVAYTGSLTAASLRLHFWDGTTWYKGAAIDLNPAGGNQSMDIDVGLRSSFFVQVESVSGTGTVQVKVESV